MRRGASVALIVASVLRTAVKLPHNRHIVMFSELEREVVGEDERWLRESPLGPCTLCVCARDGGSCFCCGTRIYLTVSVYFPF